MRANSLNSRLMIAAWLVGLGTGGNVRAGNNEGQDGNNQLGHGSNGRGMVTREEGGAEGNSSYHGRTHVGVSEESGGADGNHVPSKD